jgi:hypothetical protein
LTYNCIQDMNMQKKENHVISRIEKCKGQRLTWKSHLESGPSQLQSIDHAAFAMYLFLNNNTNLDYHQWRALSLAEQAHYASKANAWNQLFKTVDFSMLEFKEEG